MKGLSTCILGIMLLTGCHEYRVRVESGVVVGATPQKADPVYVELPDQSTITERQLLPVLMREMEKGGFNLVDNDAAAKWILVLYSSSERLAVGSTSRGIGAPIGGVVITKDKTKINYSKEITINLALYPSVEYIGGKQRSVWDGSATVTQNIYAKYTKTIIKNLLDEYGITYSDDRVLSKSYQAAD